MAEQEHMRCSNAALTNGTDGDVSIFTYTPSWTESASEEPTFQGQPQLGSAQ